MTKQVIIKNLQKLAAKLGKTPTYIDYKKEYGTYIPRRYKINDLVIEAGLKPNRNDPLSVEQIIKNLQKLAAKLGRTPRVNDYRKEYKNYFIMSYHGTYTYNDFLKMAGLTPNLSPIKYRTPEEKKDFMDSISEEKIIKKILELYKKIDKIPTYKEFVEEYKIHINNWYFGIYTYNDFLKMAGLTPEKECVKKYIRLFEKLGRLPTKAEYKEAYNSTFPAKIKLKELKNTIRGLKNKEKNDSIINISQEILTLYKKFNEIKNISKLLEENDLITVTIDVAFPKKEIIKNIEELTKKLGHIPTYREYKDFYGYYYPKKLKPNTNL